ncbi:MAG: hypothetical protein IKU04_05835 [Bacteroidales bacterium]|nr:hypothetical protein [Bacteroidales bacterium]
MKRLSLIISLCLGLAAINSCEKMSAERLSKDVPFTIKSPDGVTRTVLSKSDDTGNTEELAFSSAYFMKPSDIEGCVYTLASTNGKMVYDAIMLSMYLREGSLKIGKEPEFERIDFGLFFSSDSRNYADTFNGHVYLKEHSSEQLVLRFDKVSFKLAAGTFTLNGDLVYSGDLPPYLQKL